MIIVTGGAGFIGSNIVAALNERGRSDIVIVDTLGHGAKWNNLAKRRFLDLVFPGELDRFLAGARRADLVFHLGANSSTTASDGDEIIRANFRPSVALWNWCAEKGAPLIYASSAACYGDGSNGFSDDQSQSALDSLRPLNLYGWSKLAFDRWAMERVAQGAAPPQWAGLRFFNVYGPNEQHKGDMQSLVAKNTRTIATTGKIRLFKSYRPDFADGEQRRDFISVKDCVDAMMWLIESPGVSGLFNLGTGQARSFRDLALAIGKALGKPVAIEFFDMPETIREKYQYFTQADMTKLRRAGYAKPFHDLEAGVADYVLNYLMKDDIYR
ncbi:MAG TPA: ADP-glyceromanno-heptose 6-epimerase [Roseiarcus sp.]|nr:ADP-glyceromanno-heptose 6-epimerase [Roseiarcus sp.]